MEYSAISEMFYGNRGAFDNINLKSNNDNLLNSISENEKIVCNKLKEDQKSFQAYLILEELLNDLHLFEIETVYKEAFRFGFLMAVDLLYDNNKK